LNYAWDLVIIDETHLCARPHAEFSSQTAKMQRWGLLNAISKKTKHLVLLTATPHNGYTDSFASLLDVLDINATDKNNPVFIDKNKAKKHVCQRRRCDIMQWLKEEGSGFNPFPEREAKEVRIETLSRIEIAVHKRLKNYSQELLKLTRFLGFQYAVQFTILHFMKRALSSPEALRISLQNRIKKLNEKLSSKSIEKEINDKEALSYITESDILEDVTTEEAHRRIEQTTFGEQVNAAEIKMLTEILEDARKIKPQGDSKYTRLIKTTVPELFGYSPKIIIFTRYKDTLDYLSKNLTKSFSDVRVITIYGDMKSGERKEKFKEFESAEKAILVATDCISEGMNLQYLCSQVIHYELPWNPNRLEQRNGRVDRFGQPEDVVHIRTMIVDRTLDDDILERIIERADRIKAEFGFSPPFFNDEADIINRLVKAGKTPRTRRRRKEDDPSQLRLFDIIQDKDTAEQTDEEFDREEESMRRQLEQIKNDSFYGQTDIRLPDIERKLRETENTIGKKEEIEKFIISSLSLFNCDVKQKNEKVYSIRLNNKKLILPDGEDYIENCTFDKNYAAKNPGTELLDLSHPLVSRLVQMLKQQAYLNDNQYGRTAYKISDTIAKPIAILKVLVRYVVGTEQPSVIEEIATIGFNIYEENILPAEKVEEFESSNPLPGNRTISEFREDMQEIFTNRYWEKAIRDIIDTNKQKMIEERKHLIETLSYEELPAWVKGVTDLSYASHDIITVTIGYPA